MRPPVEASAKEAKRVASQAGALANDIKERPRIAKRLVHIENTTEAQDGVVRAAVRVIMAARPRSWAESGQATFGIAAAIAAVPIMMVFGQRPHLNP